MQAQIAAFLTIFWTILLISFISNLFILVVILRAKELRSKPSIIYIVNGAAANILFTIVVQGSGFLMIALGSDDKRIFVCRMYDLFFTFNCYVISFTITAIALDKYFAIMKPFFYLQYSTTRNALNIIKTSWIVAVIFCIPKFFTVFSGDGSRLCSKGHQHPRQASELVSEAVTLVLVFVVPSIVIFVVYGRLVHRLWISNRDSRGTDIALLKSRRKLTKLSITVTVLFVVCWVPYSVEAVWWCLGINRTRVVEWFKVYASLFVFAYSVISPIIYAFYNEATLQAAKRMFCCLCCKKCLNARSIEVAPAMP
jgi:hypothetical protein